MTNRRLPWHQRLVRRVTRHAPVSAITTPSPLSLMFVITFLGSLIALLAGVFAVAFVLATTSIGSLTFQFRQYPLRRDHEPAC